MKNLDFYSEIIKEKRPLLKSLLDKYGNSNIWSFTNDLLSEGKKQSKFYNPAFIKTVKLTFPNLSKEYLDKLGSSLRMNPLVSTADHQSPINHALYINSNTQLSLFAKSFSDNRTPYILPPTLSFSSLPLNNAAYLRGFLMATPTGEKRFTLFGTSVRHDALSTIKALTFDNKSIEQWLTLNNKTFIKEELDFVGKLLTQFSNETSVNESKTYIEQVGIWNNWMWKQFFPEYEMRYLPIDALSKSFFINELINNSNLPLYKFLFAFSEEKQVELFNGIYGCWEIDKLSKFEGGGTCFFWGIDQKNHLIPLLKKDKQLIAKDSSFSPIDWNPTSVANAWKNNRIVPSLLTNYLIMAGHFGLYCSGAFNQIGYFQPMMNQYSAALKTLGEDSESDRVAQMKTDGIHALLYFLFGCTKSKAIPLSGLNMFQQVDKIKKIENTLKQITVEESFKITAPLIIPYVVNPDEREKYNISFERSYKEIREYIPKELIIQNWEEK